MARIVAGFASSHTPLMSLPGQDWAKRAEDDKRNRELIRPRDGAHVTYDELLASADPKIAEHIDPEIFVRKFDCIQQSLNELQDTFAQVNPFGLGRAVRAAIEAWDSDARVAVVTSGGLSHFTVDEEIDRLALKGLTEPDGQILSSLPLFFLETATTEILNWVAAAGAMGETPMDLITYQPGYRSPAGTGCGCAVGRWIPE